MMRGGGGKKESKANEKNKNELHKEKALCGCQQPNGAPDGRSSLQDVRFVLCHKNKQLQGRKTHSIQF